MSSIYTFSDEVPALLTVASNDIMMIWDTSAGTMKRSTVTQVNTIVKDLARGTSGASLIGFYGATAIDQGTFTAVNLTALATATISAGNAAGTWAWSSSTMASEFVTRAQQAQVDLKTLAQRIGSTGLVSIAGI